MNTHETQPETETLKPQFFCRYCSQWKFEIDRLPTSRQGNFICASCDDKRKASIAKNTSKIHRWHQHG
jgi:transcription elongation factor Elf1